MLFNNKYLVSPLFERQIIWIIFILICMIGTILAFYPSLSKGVIIRSNINYSGHHPNCQYFFSHTIKIIGKKYCAGCLGLATGGTISIILSLFLIIKKFNIESGFIYPLLGSFLILFGLLQYQIDSDNPFLHFFLNVGFVIGAFLTLLGTEVLLSNVFVEAYFLALTVFLILTRIILSNEEHIKICTNCGLKCAESFIKDD